MSDAVPSPKLIAKDISKVVTTGLSISRMTNLPILFSLALVRTQAPTNQVLDLAIALDKLVREAVGALGTGPTGQAVEALLGISEGTRGLLVRQRRDIAADIVGIKAESFRKTWESRLIGELADEIYRLESEAHIPVRVRPRKGRTPVLQELAGAPGGKTLDRRESEARLWSHAYGVRADLLAVARLRRSRSQSRKLGEAIDTALWSYARYVEQYARHVDDFGSALVIAGNEVTAQEAASLLRIATPLTDDQFVRIRLAVRKAQDRHTFIARLQSSTTDSKTLQTWRLWLG